MAKQQITELVQEIRYSSIPRESQSILLNLVENYLVDRNTAARLTFENENGTWGIKGYDIKKVPKELYGAMCKLRDYERIIESPQKLLEVDNLYSDKCKEINRLHIQLAEVKKQLSICTVGDIVYFVSFEKEKIYELPITQIRSVQVGTEPSYFYDSGKFQFCNYDIGNSIFLSEEEAKEALQKREMK